MRLTGRSSRLLKHARGHRNSRSADFTAAKNCFHRELSYPFTVKVNSPSPVTSGVVDACVAAAAYALGATRRAVENAAFRIVNAA
jgi:hypothetical protein